MEMKKEMEQGKEVTVQTGEEKQGFLKEMIDIFK